ncbi:hypothetical protein SAMD00019534_004050 [Acytostelium subglobosum LB1]|uniref:hypothetical protein n=1 Tax=Acytostelium subglobosum LB1 TaxID=1410327 RepID=UPI0006448592|nr:hypothetical protein SAMD00019534_004050 [Acytostelium subglobosum LB1]GAM17230.1 hypothetical protein SAMD00019534_004050 [Acytostelium subglobosum LB1]|eukprot:XP_012759292.1 hypothetical protein SAMD00019534_004050 [Acytostelium subglobosum LB1]
MSLLRRSIDQLLAVGSGSPTQESQRMEVTPNKLNRSDGFQLTPLPESTEERTREYSWFRMVQVVEAGSL